MKTFSIALALAASLSACPAFAEPASCPNASDQLADLLDGAMKRAGREGQLTAEFEVDAQGRVQHPMVQGPRDYQWPVRMAVEMLHCQAGTPQRYAVSIRFADPARRSVVAAPPVTVAIAASSPR